MGYIAWTIYTLAFAFVLFMIWYFKRNPRITSKYQTLFKFNGSLKEAQKLIPQAMEQANFKSINVSDDRLVYRAKTGFSMSSWWEDIEVRVVEENEGVQVAFLSICGSPFQFYDFGKNKRNYISFCRKGTCK